MIDAPCGCAREPHRVGTCEECLPRGAITWLIENGRQLDLWKDEGVAMAVRGDDADDSDQVIKPPQDSPGEVLPF